MPTANCFCRRSNINVHSSPIVINYQRCSDLATIFNLQLNANSAPRIYYVQGTFSTAFPQSAYHFSNTTIWPIGCGSPTPTPSTSITPTPTPTITPSISVSVTVTPSITVSKTPSVTPSVTPSISSTPTVSLSVTPSATPSISTSATPSVSITPTSTPSPSVSNTPSISVTSSVSPSVTPSISVSATPGVSLTPTSTISVTPSVTPSVSPSVTPTVSISNTPSISVSPSLSATPSISVSSTPSPTPSISISTTPSITVTPSISISVTPSISVSQTPGASSTPSISISPTPSVTPSISISATPSVTPSISISATPSVTPSITVSPSTVIYRYTADLLSCCDAGYAFEGVKIQSTSELQSSYVVVADAGSGNQCWTLSNVTSTSFVTPDFVITEFWPSPFECSVCDPYYPCPSPTPSVTASVTPSVTPSISVSVTPSITATPSVTPTISLTPSITPSTPPLLNEVTNCSTSTTYLVNFSLIGYVPTGPVTYLNMAAGSTAPTGCYTISSSEPPIGPSDGLVTDIGDNSTTCIQCTGKPIPSPSATPSISITPSPTISLTPSISITPTISPSLTPSASQTVFTLTLTTETGADTCAKGELRIKKNGSVVAVWDKNAGFTTVVPSQSTVTFTSSDTMVLEGFSQGGGGAGCFATTDTIVRGYYGASLEVIASTEGTNPDTFTIPNANATIGAQFLAVS